MKISYINYFHVSTLIFKKQFILRLLQINTQKLQDEISNFLLKNKTALSFRNKGKILKRDTVSCVRENINLVYQKNTV